MEVDPDSGTLQRISQRSRRCMEFYTGFRKKNLLCDAVLRLEDGGIFPVHSVILSARSAYFRTLFTTTLHSKEKTDVLPGVTSQTMMLMLEYSYMRSVD
jgi:kelch-like protein 10